MAWAYNTQEGTPNNGSMIASIALAVTALSLVALCLRIYVRTRIAKAVGLGTYLERARRSGLRVLRPVDRRFLLEFHRFFLSDRSDLGLMELTDDWLIIAGWVCFTSPSLSLDCLNIQVSDQARSMMGYKYIYRGSMG